MQIKKGNILFIGSVVGLIVVFYLYNNGTIMVRYIAEDPPSIISEVEAGERIMEEIEAITTELYKEAGLFDQINNQLKEKGYEYQMLLVIYSMDDIRVQYVLANKEATESRQEEIKSIFFESVENNNLDANSFNLKVDDMFH